MLGFEQFVQKNIDVLTFSVNMDKTSKCRHMNFVSDTSDGLAWYSGGNLTKKDFHVT